MRASDPRAREILERTEALTPEELMRLHGAIREFGGARDERLGRARARRRRDTVDGRRRRACGRGSRVRLRPRARRRRLRPRARRPDGGRRGDRAGHGGRRAPRRRASRTTRAATSATRRQPGHRFFFAPEEVEPLGDAAPRRRARILVAGIGNVFLGDDGFGVALAGRLAPARAARRASRSSTSASAAWTSPTRCRTATTPRVLVDAVAARRAAGHAVRDRARARRRPSRRSTRTAMDPVQVLGAGARARRRCRRGRWSSAASRRRA